MTGRRSVGRLVLGPVVVLLLASFGPASAAGDGGRVADLRTGGPAMVARAATQRPAVADEKAKDKKKPPRKKAKKAKEKGKEGGEREVVRRGIDGSETWRTETQVFSAAQLEKLEPILHRSTCTNEKTGCTYQEDGRPGSEASFAFRLIPWKVSQHRAFLVRNDRCSAGGCDEGLFVLIDGQWRMLIETFGVLQRAGSTTLGFRDLTFRPRGQPPVDLVWDGRGYKENN